MGRAARFALASLVMATIAGSTSPALAHHGGVEVEGKCSQGSEFKLEIDADNRYLDTKFEVDQGVEGDRWGIVITDNGMVIFRGYRVTEDRGKFEVEVHSMDQNGPDTVMAKATNVSTGEVCRAQATI